MIPIDRDLNRATWQERIDAQAASSLSQKAWCQENEINIHNFIYWKKRLNEIKKQDKNPLQFIALSPKINTSHSPIVLKIGAAAIEIHENFNLNLLDDLVRVLIRYA